MVCRANRWRDWAVVSAAKHSWKRISQAGSVSESQDALQGRISHLLNWRNNLDILECIIREVHVQDLPSVALVCRDWALAARGPLYARLTFDTWSGSAPLITRTMRTSPHLRHLVHSLVLIIHSSTYDIDPLDWLHLMPEGGVHDFTVRQYAFDIDFTTFILQSPFIQSIRRLKGMIDFIQTSKHLHDCLALPHLEHLSLYVPSEIDIGDPILVPSKLRYFALACSPYVPSILRLLAATVPQLEELVFDTGVDPPRDEDIPRLLTTLHDCAHRLPRLTIRADHHPDIPYFDHISHCTPSLDYLHLGPGLFGSALFLDISRRLRHLRLEHHSGCPFPFADAEEMILRAGRGELSLQSFVIVFYGPEGARSRFARIGELCRECRIDFRLITNVKSLAWWHHTETVFSERL